MFTTDTEPGSPTRQATFTQVLMKRLQRTKSLCCIVKGTRKRNLTKLAMAGPRALS